MEANRASAPRRRVYAAVGRLRLNQIQEHKTFNKGSLGSRIDEERSEARNVMDIASQL